MKALLNFFAAKTFFRQIDKPSLQSSQPGLRGRLKVIGAPHEAGQEQTTIERFKCLSTLSLISGPVS